MDFVIEIITKYQNEFQKESDRAAGILSISLIEDTLESLIKGYLCHGLDEDDIFEGYGPLSTFNSKIDFAFGIGLISRKLRHDLHFFRKIRNEFAHASGGCDFENPSIRDRILDLQRSIVSMKPLIDAYIRHGKLKGSIRERFHILTILVYIDLADKLDKVKHVESCDEEGLYNPEIYKNIIFP